MITWLLAVFLLLWIFEERLLKKKNVVGVPLGLPEGTVRACIALLIVTFPLNQLILYELFPSLFPITIQQWYISTLFVVVAFYFEARAFEKSIPQLLKEIKDPAKYVQTRNELPLYFPRFTVRIILFSLLILTVVLTGLGVFSETLEFSSTNTITELIFIVFFFIIGLIFRRIHQKQLKRKIQTRLREHEGTHEELIEILEEQERKIGRVTEGFLAILMLSVLIIVLIFYTINWNRDLFFIPLVNVQVSLRMGMILLFNLYFGYRQ
ncbi:MAG: hypothetical protein JW776_14305 [Candidatus Lokiarchaeota archaeon]|nr:hypothetical protein [Candidatus Lokiarchaeota archaeon]